MGVAEDLAFTPKAVPPEGPNLHTPHDKAFTLEALDIPKLRDLLHQKAFATEALLHQKDLDQKSFASPQGFYTSYPPQQQKQKNFYILQSFTARASPEGSSAAPRDGVDI